MSNVNPCLSNLARKENMSNVNPCLSQLKSIGYRLSQRWSLWFGVARRRSQRRGQQHGGAANKLSVVGVAAGHPAAFRGRHGGVALPDCQRPRACCRRWPWWPPPAKRRPCRTRWRCPGGSQQGEASKHWREVPQCCRGRCITLFIFSIFFGSRYEPLKI